MARLQCALIGVLISVTTIPVAASVGVAAAYRDWTSFRGSLGQLAVNIAALLAAGTLTLVVQRAIYARRRAAHERRRGARHTDVLHQPEDIEERRRPRRGARIG
jgi:hypothetical protein